MDTFMVLRAEMLDAGIDPQKVEEILVAGQKLVDDIYERRRAEFEGEEWRAYFGTVEACLATALAIEAELVRLARIELALRAVIQQEVRKAEAKALGLPVRVLVVRM